MKDRNRIGRPRYRRSTVALMLITAACSGDSCNENTLGVDPESNVFVSVTLTGDGDGRVDVNTGQTWNCSIAVGEVRAFGTDVTLAGNRCSWETYDAGGGGRVTFNAVPGSGSVFSGWSSRCQGSDPECVIEWITGGANISAGAEFLFSPSDLTVEVANAQLESGMTTGATATYQSSRTLQGVQYTWISSNPAVASVSGTGSQATVTAIGDGTTLITASTRGITSNEVSVTVGPPQPGLGVLEGILYDVDHSTPVDSIYLLAGPVAGSSATTVLRTLTGRQDPAAGVTIPAGGYRVDAEPGRYAVFSVGVVGKRYISTRGDSANVVVNQTTTLDLYADRGDHLDMLGTDLGTIQAAPGSTLNLVVSYRAWSYWACPLCGISLGIGVDSTALAVHVFPQTAGTYPGRTDADVSIPITVPDHGGTIYATLITTSTSASNIEPGLKQYRDRWAANVQGTTMIPIGTLTVN